MSPKAHNEQQLWLAGKEVKILQLTVLFYKNLLPEWRNPSPGPMLPMQQISAVLTPTIHYLIAMPLAWPLLTLGHWLSSSASAKQPLIDYVHVTIPCSHGLMYSHRRAWMLALETWTAILKQDNSKGEADKKNNCDKSAGSWRCWDIYIYIYGKATQIYISYTF